MASTTPLVCNAVRHPAMVAAQLKTRPYLLIDENVDSVRLTCIELVRAGHRDLVMQLANTAGLDHVRKSAILQATSVLLH